MSFPPGLDQQQPEEDKLDEVTFHPMKTAEYGFPPVFGAQQLPAHITVRPMHKTYHCGECGDRTNGRVLCDLKRSIDKAKISWCVCSCDRREPSVVIEKDGTLLRQIPLSREFHAQEDWPDDLAALYEEAAQAYGAGAFTAASMVCRKLLMACACDKKAEDGKRFVEYVDYITDEVLVMPSARESIEKIKDIGNEANHKIQFVPQEQAKQAMRIVTYLLTTVYSLPSASDTSSNT